MSPAESPLPIRTSQPWRLAGIKARYNGTFTPPVSNASIPLASKTSALQAGQTIPLSARSTGATSGMVQAHNGEGPALQPRHTGRLLLVSH
ncbi:MAG: hypothetical protein IPM88_20825 [Nitrospira sp.]|nr:hypothetical protein [Nitrospira sp.]